MSTLEKNIPTINLSEKVYEEFQEKFKIALSEDRDLCAALADKLLGGLSFPVYYKKGDKAHGEEVILHHFEEEIYDKILEAFEDSDGCCMDIRALAEKAFNITV